MSKPVVENYGGREEAKNIRDKIKQEMSKLQKEHRYMYDHDHEYIPEDLLRKWVDKSAVGKWVEASNILLVGGEYLRDQICANALKTFCILIEIQREEWIRYFLQFSLSTKGPDGEQLIAQRVRDITSEVGESWSREKCEECEKQWYRYNAARLEYGQLKRLMPGQIPPFRSAVLRNEGRAELYEVEFDAQYLDKKPVSMKEEKIPMMLKSTSLSSDDQERAFLKYLRAREKQPDAQYVEVYGWYIRGQKRHLLMRLYDGNLKEFLNDDKNVKAFRNDDDYLTAMLELSRALATLHNIEVEGKLWNVRGVHYDVKPANILLDQHLFVLADFDISKIIFPPYPRQESLGNQSWYHAPETISSDDYGGQAGLESDAFSLGCVFLEVLVHMKGGAGAVGDFRYRRRPDKLKKDAPFWEDEHSPKLSQAVLGELDEIERDTNSVKRARYAGIVRKMLAVDMRNRLSAKDAEKEFGDIEEQLNKQPHHQGLPVEPNAGHLIKPARLSHDAIGSHSSPGFSHCSREMNSTDVPTDACTVDEILSRFTDKCEYKNDCQSLLRTHLTIQQEGQTKNLWGKKTWIPCWAKALTSSTLFLHGSDDEDGMLLSFISSRIVKSAEDFQPSPNMVVLQHFCGKNAKNGDEAVYIMMQSLIHQLLSDRSELNGLDQRIDAISGRDLDALWESFASFIKELPSEKTVVCVIDGLQSYCQHSENLREERAKEAEELLPRFIKMASVHWAVAPCFKLFLTASKKSIAARLSKYCDPDSRNPHGIPDDEDLDLQGLSNSFWTKNKLPWK